MRYDADLQKLFLSILLSDKELYIKTKTITKREYFSQEVKPIIETILDFETKYNGLPTPNVIKAETGLDVSVTELDKSEKKWFLDEYPRFCRRMAATNAVMESSVFIKEERYEEMEKSISDAMKVRLSQDFGLDYSANPKERLMNIKNRSGNISNGFEALDHAVGKANLGDLIIFVGGSGTGKSLFLQNIAAKHWREGKNVLYFTLELHPELCARRMDAMNLDVTTDSLYDDIDDSDLTLRKMATKAGKMKIVYMPSGSKTSEIKSFIEDYQLNTGIEVDSIFVDYLDLLSPVQKVSLGDTFHKDKFVSEELRNMSQDLELVCFTASQLNRSGTTSGEDMAHEHIAGGISKINTADLVIGIIIDDVLRAEGKYILKALKVRNGVGTGATVDLKYNTFTMRIEDDPEFLNNINTFMKNPKKRVISETEKTMLDIQNQLNSNSKDYDPVDIETGKVIPHKIAAVAGVDKLEKLNSLLSSDDF